MAHMSDPRVVEHMPLATGHWDRQACLDFIQAKEERWRHDGLGHWAFLSNDRYVGWGGFQLEGGEWDFGLVLKPESFGLGAHIARKAISIAKADPRIPYVTFLLAPTRRHLRGLERYGASHLGAVEHDGKQFLKFRLETPPD